LIRAETDRLIARALGLVQVMPATYAELRARHRLGVDMFYPRDARLLRPARIFAA
jgi:soluble lytic murein transglycosylase-like protein